MSASPVGLKLREPYCRLMIHSEQCSHLNIYSESPSIIAIWLSMYAAY